MSQATSRNHRRHAVRVLRTSHPERKPQGRVGRQHPAVADHRGPGVEGDSQIQEQTLSFVPKLFAVAGTFLIALPWMLQLAIKYTTELFRSFPMLIG